MQAMFENNNQELMQQQQQQNATVIVGNSSPVPNGSMSPNPVCGVSSPGGSPPIGTLYTTYIACI